MAIESCPVGWEVVGLLQHSEFLGFTITFLVVLVMSLAGCGVLFFLERKKEREHKPKVEDYQKRSRTTNGNGKF